MMTKRQMDRLSITVQAHPSLWANVLRRLLRDADSTRAYIRKTIAAGTLSRAEGAMWLVDIDQAQQPIVDAVRAALAKNPGWRRWFEDITIVTEEEST